MRKLLCLLCLVAMTLPTMAAELELVVAAGSPGRVDDKTIDVNGLPADTRITLELRLNGLDVAPTVNLAGWEGQFTFPTWVYMVNTNDIGQADPPFEVDASVAPLADQQKLPADNTGADTDRTFRNDQGTVRIGSVIKVAASRPSTGNVVLATMDFVLGRDFDLNLNSRTLDTCTSATEVIRFVACATGDPSCHIVANELAQAANVDFTQAGTSVTITNSTALGVKGDVNSSGSLTVADISPMVRCAVFGQADGNCPLNAASTDEYLTKADMNCSGNVSVLDVTPTVRRALGLIGRASSKTDATSFDAPEDGFIYVPGGKVASVSSLEFQVNGNAQFKGEIQLDDAARQDGWVAVGNYIASANVYKYALFNSKGVDAVVPDIQIPVQAQPKTSMWIRNSEHYTTDDQSFAFQPKAETVAIDNAAEVSQ